jgi:hypothetical protein
MSTRRMSWCRSMHRRFGALCSRACCWPSGSSLAKVGAWSRTLNIYASVRSEAFGSGADHPDMAQALGLAMPLGDSEDEPPKMVADRIRQADPAGLAVPDLVGTDPLHALCGFASVVHADRHDPEGVPYQETTFASILRHTRRIPRELIAIAGATYHSNPNRSMETVRRTTNAAASENISSAIGHSFLGWSDSVHQPFACALEGEAVDGKSILDHARRHSPEPAELVKFFVLHGLLGTAEAAPERHRHCYIQRFAYDEVHGNDNAVSVDKPFFFVHPALKEWIHARRVEKGTPFRRLETGVVGDMLGFESQPPLIRLGTSGRGFTIHLREVGFVAAGDAGVASDPLKFLFVLLWACRLYRRERISIAEIREAWLRLRALPALADHLRVALPTLDDEFAIKMRDWAKKINAEPGIRKLKQIFFPAAQAVSTARGLRPQRGFGLVSVRLRKSMLSRPEASILGLPLHDLDWGSQLRAIAGRHLALRADRGQTLSDEPLPTGIM